SWHIDYPDISAQPRARAVLAGELAVSPSPLPRALAGSLQRASLAHPALCTGGSRVPEETSLALLGGPLLRHVLRVSPHGIIPGWRSARRRRGVLGAHHRGQVRQ